MAGQVWSPGAGTKTECLVELAEAMRNYCWTGAPEWLQVLQANAEALPGFAP